MTSALDIIRQRGRADATMQSVAPKEFDIINYYLGDKFRQTRPYFYVKEPMEAPTPPWRAQNQFTRWDGTLVDEAGYATETWHFAPIVWGKYPVIKQDGVWVPADTSNGVWPKGAKYHTRVLGWAKEFERPVVLSVRGQRSVVVWELLEMFQSTYLAFAEGLVGGKIYPWSYYMPIIPELDASGKPVYRPTKTRSADASSNFHTQPILRYPKGDPALISERSLDALFVGEERLDGGRRLWQRYFQWVSLPQGAVMVGGTDEGRAPGDAAEYPDWEGE